MQDRTLVTLDAAFVFKFFGKFVQVLDHRNPLHFYRKVPSIHERLGPPHRLGVWQGITILRKLAGALTVGNDHDHIWIGGVNVKRVRKLA